jgi:hypothetical protein
MIAHLVLFKPKPGLSDADRQQILADLSRAASEIPTIRRVQVGRRIRHGLPGYEQLMREDFEYLAIIECDSLEDLKAYLTHPAHAAIGRHFTQSSSAALAYDYELAIDSEDGTARSSFMS